MQDNINYRIATKINNWFANDNEVWDTDANYFKPADTKFFCHHCQTYKSIKLKKTSYDSQNRERSKCSTCYDFIKSTKAKPIKTKGVK